jgi:hypothetical protein
MQWYWNYRSGAKAFCAVIDHSSSSYMGFSNTPLVLSIHLFPGSWFLCPLLSLKDLLYVHMFHCAIEE